MSDNTPIGPSTTANTLTILQLNTRRSWVVTHSLLNDPTTSRFHFLLIQEPYLSPTTSLPIAHSNWPTILSDIATTSKYTPPEDKTLKSLIYVDKTIPSTSLTTIGTQSNCVAAVQLSADNHSIMLISSYAPPKQAHKLANLLPLISLSASKTSHLLIAMDCNLHHPLWIPPNYPHTHREADDLILTMGEAGLNLRSKCGIPTFYPSNPNHASTTADLTWVSPMLFDWTHC